MLKKRFIPKLLGLLGVGSVLLWLFCPMLVTAQSGTPLENFIRRTLPRRAPEAGQNTLLPAPESEQEPFSLYPPIIIDPGHGGEDTGGQSSNGLQEKEVTLRIAQQLAQQMANILPFTPLLTRTSDIALTATERASFANSKQGVLFISLHTGSTGAGSSPVHRVYVYGGSGKESGLAEGTPALVQWEQSQLQHQQASLRLAKKMREALQNTLGEAVHLHQDIPLLPLEGLQMPAILIEIGHLIPEEAAKRLADPLYQNQIAQGIMEGIRWYIASPL